MKLLILGGTLFQGRHLVELALRRGHEVTLFNRGQHNADLFPQVEKLRGDRQGDLLALRGRRWDAVIDTCGYVPRVVRASAQLLAEAVEHYTFISSVSVYASFARPDQDETAPLGTLADPSEETVTGESYGPLKVLCEQAAEEVMPGRVLAVRPGYIVGPFDFTDRFTYWPWRVTQGGSMLAPGQPDRPIQFIDACDLTAWTLSMAERRQTGAYNATGPVHRLTWGQLLEESRTVTGSATDFNWVPDEFLAAQGLDSGNELPLWTPDTGEFVSIHAINCAKAIAAGLTFRPVAETIRDTLAWLHETRPAGAGLKVGLPLDREAAVLKAWQASSPA